MGGQLFSPPPLHGTKFSKVFKRIKKSSPALSCLHESQKQLKVLLCDVVQKIVCRWNTDFFMVERCLLMQNELKMMLLKFDDPEFPDITKDDWKTAVDLGTLLASLNSCCEDLCGQKYSTSSRSIPSVAMVLET